jgi:hypothetical protein
LPDKILGLPLTRPDIAKIKLTHLAPQCLQGLHRSSSLGKIPKELCVKITLSIDLTFHPHCSPFPGTYFVCGTTAYACLPPDWRGICTLAFLIPQINIIPNSQSLPIPLAAYTQSKRAIQIIPLLVVMGITAGIGAGIGGIASSIHTHQKLSKEVSDDIEQVTQSLEALQDQAESLASVVLQNRHTLYLLTAGKGGTCLFTDKECCFYTNKSGVVRDMA